MFNTKLIAFAGRGQLAEGEAASVALAVRHAQDAGEAAPILVFEVGTGRPVDLDLRGSDEDIRLRLQPAAEPARGPGRPKLGVVPREVTLLPRHWEWLAGQPGGASVALRRLVDEARHASEAKDRVRIAREAAYRFMSAMAGDEPHFEEAIRALFAGEQEKFSAMIDIWPKDVKAYVRRLAEEAF